MAERPCRRPDAEAIILIAIRPRVWVTQVLEQTLIMKPPAGPDSLDHVTDKVIKKGG